MIGSWVHQIGHPNQPMFICQLLPGGDQWLVYQRWFTCAYALPERYLLCATENLPEDWEQTEAWLRDTGIVQ